MKSRVVEQDTHSIVRSIESDLKQLQGKSLLITGATGFIGTYLLESLALLNDSYSTSPCRVVGIARDPQRLERTAPHLLNRQDIQIRHGDVRTFEFPESFDYVIHAAAPVDPGALRRDRLGAVETIVNGTHQVLQQSIRHSVKRLLYISSGAVYGKQPPDLPQLVESYLGGPDITDPAWAYGEAKRYAEVLCSVFHQSHNLSVVVARPFTFVGPYQSLEADFAVTQFIRSALRGEPIRIEGDGTPLRSYCYGADLAVALWKIILRGKAGCAYNVGAEEPLSILELARKVVSATGAEVELTIAREPVPGQKPARYIPDITRLKTELGVYPKFKLDDALARTIAWARETSTCEVDDPLDSPQKRRN